MIDTINGAIGLLGSAAIIIFQLVEKFT